MLIQKMKRQLPELLSKRVFLTGGGYAKGFDGNPIEGLRNDRVGKYNNTRAVISLIKDILTMGFLPLEVMNGMVEPEAYKHTPLASPHILTYPDAMRSSH